MAGSASHRARDPRKDLADVDGNARHDGARRNSDEAGHQSIFNKVLALGVLEDRERPEKILDSVHFVHSSPYSFNLSAAEVRITFTRGLANTRKHLIQF